VPWVVQVDRLGQAQAVAPAVADYRPTDPSDRLSSRRFIEQVRSIPADAIIVRQNWLRAYDFTTDRGAMALNDYARANDPFTKVGKQQVAVDVSSVIRASPDSFRVAWTERRYEDGQLAETTERWTAILTVVVQPAAQRRPAARQPARNLRQRHQLVTGAWAMKPAVSVKPATRLPHFRTLALLLCRGARRLRHAQKAAGDLLRQRRAAAA
jgi:type IV secretory pathway TrbF-like protein